MNKLFLKIISLIVTLVIFTACVCVPSFAADSTYTYKVCFQNTQATNKLSSTLSAYIKLYSGSSSVDCGFKNTNFTTVNKTGQWYAKNVSWTKLADKAEIYLPFYSSSTELKGILFVYITDNDGEEQLVLRENVTAKPSSGNRYITKSYSIDTSQYESIFNPKPDLGEPYVTEINVWPRQSGKNIIKLSSATDSQTRNMYIGGSVGTPEYTVTKVVDQYGDEWTSSPPQAVIDNENAQLQSLVFRTQAQGSTMARISFNSPPDGLDYTVKIDFKYTSENDEHPYTSLSEPIVYEVYTPHTLTIKTGAANDTEEVLYTSDSMVLPQPQKAGYMLKGWEINGMAAVDKDSESENYVLTMGNGNACASAIWEINHEHNYDFVSSDAYTHKEVCSVCGEQKTESHLFDSEGKCLCGEVMEKFSITVPQGCTVKQEIKAGSSYYIATIQAPKTNSSGDYFTYWLDGSGRIVGTYRTYAFYVVDDASFTPVYTPRSQYESERQKAVISSRILTVKQRPDGTAVIIAEHSVSSTENSISGHGVLASTNPAFADESRLTCEAEDDEVLNFAARNSQAVLTGLLEIRTKLSGDTVWVRPYVISEDGDVVLGEIQSFALNAGSDEKQEEISFDGTVSDLTEKNIRSESDLQTDEAQQKTGAFGFDALLRGIMNLIKKAVEFIKLSILTLR